MKRPVIGYENTYEISEDGKVFRTMAGDNTFIGKELKPRLSHRKFLTVNLSQCGVVATKKVHRLLAEAFLPNPDQLPIVKHKDSNKAHNHHSNLEWTSYSRKKEL